MVFCGEIISGVMLWRAKMTVRYAHGMGRMDWMGRMGWMYLTIYFFICFLHIMLKTINFAKLKPLNPKKLLTI